MAGKYAPGVTDWQVSRLVGQRRIEVFVECATEADSARITDQLAAILRGDDATD